MTLNQFPIITGQSYYYMPGGSNPSTAQPLNGQALFVPIWLPTGITLDRLGIEVTTGGSAGALVRLALFRDSGGCFPQVLILDAGTIATTTTGNKEITISQAITSTALYWLCAATQGAPSTRPIYRAFHGLATNLPFVWSGTSPPGAVVGSGYSYSGITGAFPTALAIPGLSILTALTAMSHPYVRVA